MNIFYLSENPVEAAEAMVDRHVVKMILESAQLLSTAHRVLDGEDYKLFDARESVLYKVTHVNHPSAKWCRESIENYNWLVDHTFALMSEYTYRYDKTHKCFGELSYLLQSPPKNLKEWDATPVKLAMPDEYKIENNPVQSYRNYYKMCKQHLFKWTRRERPEWLKS